MKIEITDPHYQKMLLLLAQLQGITLEQALYRAIAVDSLIVREIKNGCKIFSVDPQTRKVSFLKLSIKPWNTLEEL